ncbi:hypothetical protein LOD99_5587 [Oopsacas minuta]|uniref:Uncharacterized protein n=1 Tax=Oopsacas minuta TaxID=111878 RepID=A0AAV7JRD4_9METZ|nr:hypothetical protein LOD99_5587 [Oopsacas minuta]
MVIAPPKEERNIPVASGVDRGGVISHQLDTPAGIIMVKNNVIVTDRYGDTVTFYRAVDLAAKVTWENNLEISGMNRQYTISIPQACCTTSNSKHLYVGTLKPSLIRIQVDPLRIEQGYLLNPILHTKIPNRYPWLQDMKAVKDCVLCLFTGSPSPLQIFSLEGEFIGSMLTEDQIVGAYNFHLFYNLITEELRIYICDFWDNSIKVFDQFGKFIETVCETGHELCQIFRPSCIFIEDTGYVIVGDMKKNNCLQRL